MNCQLLATIAEVVLALATVGLAFVTWLLARQAREEAKAAGRLADQAARQAEATRILMFVQATLSLYGLFENRDARKDRKSIYEEVVRVVRDGGKDIAERAGLEELRECVERVAGGFDYLGRLMEEEDRLRDLAIRFYGIPAIKSWAVIKPYVKHMIKSGRRQSNFHEAFRKFAETAAKDERLCDLPGIQGGHEVWIDSKGEIIKLSIWDGDNTEKRDKASYKP